MKKIFTDRSFLVFTGLAFLAALGCYGKGGAETVREGLKAGWEMLVLVGPRLVAAFLVAGYVQVLIPRELILRWIGAESGLRGILIATAVGVITPGGPIISFPLVAALFKLGAGYGPLVAYLTSWSILGFYRMVIYEIPFMGTEFAIARFSASLVLPVLAGLSAQRIAPYFESTAGREKE